jgi:hypothetical protein
MTPIICNKSVLEGAKGYLMITYVGLELVRGSRKTCAAGADKD